MKMEVIPLFCLILSILTLLFSRGEGLFVSHDLVPSRKLAVDYNDFDWPALRPSTDLKYWQTCHDGLECARLEVPLDWRNTTNPNRVVLAIIRLPAKVNRTDDSYGGPIILNPGGPGGSGVDFLIWAGNEIQANLDGEKYFDIVSFDPRGIQHTSPPASCFDSWVSRQLSSVEINSQGAMDLSDVAFNNRWAAQQSLSQVCSEYSDSKSSQYPDGSDIRQFVSSAMVVYDMLAIIDKLEEATVPSAQRGDSVQGPPAPALLQYWGFSYGTLLGNTFASMFPARIGRLILDGVGDPVDYYTTRWSSNLHNTTNVWTSFSEFCYEAQWKCALYDPNVKSANDIERKVGKLLEHLRNDPLATVGDNGTVQITGYTEVNSQIFSSLYYPAETFPGLATTIAALINLTTSSPAPVLSPTNDVGTSSSEPPTPEPSQQQNISAWDQPQPPAYPHAGEAGPAIWCGDGDSLRNRTKAQQREFINFLKTQSPMFAGIWSETTTLPCISYPEKFHPSEDHRFTGPFGSRLSDLDSRASPILWISNTADPVTPHVNAVNNAKTHEGSVVLTVDQHGHCSGPLNPSRCAYEAAKTYFSTGTLPKEGTICLPDRVPWQD